MAGTAKSAAWRICRNPDIASASAAAFLSRRHAGAGRIPGCNPVYQASGPRSGRLIVKLPFQLARWRLVLPKPESTKEENGDLKGLELGIARRVNLYKHKLGREAAGKAARNPQTAICWRLLSAQRVCTHAVFFRWFRLRCETADFVNGARPDSFPVVPWKHPPFWRFTAPQ
jgi:hypothetical protein